MYLRARRPFAVLLLGAVAACSAQPSTPTPVNQTVSTDALAPATLPTSIQMPAENAAGVSSVPTALPSPPAPPPSPDADNVIAETSLTPDSAKGAADIVQTYYALIEERKYREAWRLWGNKGQASGMSASAFAASFAKYRDYHATVGAPGRIDAGAGQRYVTVPVKVYGRLTDGNRDFAMEGPVTLHRTGDIDGATTEQKSWRISDSGVRPRPS